MLLGLLLPLCLLACLLECGGTFFLALTAPFGEAFLFLAFTRRLGFLRCLSFCRACVSKQEKDKDMV